jgi:hypothetical protein
LRRQRERRLERVADRAEHLAVVGLDGRAQDAMVLGD